ncbi:MAG: DNA-binding transcriptional LysR family regulator [Rickettsiales bacterium]|jgi:DNA-binding transcriptional LysR family regulator
MKYDLKDLITFTHVAKLKSFARTCEVLNISQAVASSRVSELEKSSKLSLLARTTREVNLTSDGQVFFDYCMSIIEKVDDLNHFLDKNKGVSGVLKLVLPAYFSRHHIVPYLNEFLEKYPDLKLKISLTENPVNIISEGYDLQVRIQVPEEENLGVTKLMNNYKIVCASPEYIKKFGAPKTPQDLHNHNCIIFGENNIWSFKNKETNKVVNLDNLNGNITCNNGEIIKELVMSGIGITLKSERDVSKEISNKELVVLLSDYEIIDKTQFYVVYPKSKHTPPKVRAFIDFFQKKDGV